jgi:hypothetical protein
MRASRLRQPTLGCLLLFLLAPSLTLTGTPVSVSLGRSVADLNGPWKFHTGDDPAWSDPAFDDSGWEAVDLTAPPGAHDRDVGLTGYVAGWSARGHSGYIGYAWYRLHVEVNAPNGEELAIAGPRAVDSAYQIFVNGKLLGSAGNFSRLVPRVFSIQPRMFLLSQEPAETGDPEPPSLVLAIRVWMGPWESDDPGAGGIHIAPVIGERDSVGARYEQQWMETVRGYIVEVVEALAFLLLAVMAWCVRAFDTADSAYVWLSAALVLTALYRANQAVFFWGQIETVHAFELISIVLLIPLCLAAWTMAWHTWHRLTDTEGVLSGVAILLVSYMAGQFLKASWFHGAFSDSVEQAADLAIRWSRLMFAGLTAAIAYRGIRQSPREGWLTLPALLLVSIGLFAQELSDLQVQGIWFPLGTGVSRTQFAYAAFDFAMFALLWDRLRRFAARYRRTPREMKARAEPPLGDAA